MDAVRVQSLKLQKPCEHLDHALGVAEYDHALKTLCADDLRKGADFLALVDLQTVLQNIGLVLLLRLHGDLLRIALVHPADVHDLAGDRGGKHAEVAAGFELVENARDIVDKAHVEHTVRLVDDDGFDAFKPDRAALHVVREPARRGDNDLRTLFQRLDLPSDRRAAVKADNADPRQKRAQVAQLARDLQGKLARGRKDHRFGLLAAAFDVLHDRNAEREGLSGAGRRLGDHVLPLAHGRNTARLHRCALLDLLFLQCTHDFRKQAQRIKAHALCELHTLFLCLSLYL